MFEVGLQLVKFIGLDIGTTTICGVLFDATTGEVVDSITMPNHSSIDTPNDWERTQDPEIVLETVQLVLSELTATCPHPDGIGVTGQMHGVLYVNAEGIHVSPIFTWQDKRGDLPYIDGATYSQVLSNLTGYAVPTGYGMVTHYYHVMNGIVPLNAVSMCTIADYIVMRLTERRDPVVDITNAASIGLFDLCNNQFDPHALRAATIQSRMAPSVVSSATHAGLWGNTPVFSALGDNQASYLGSVKSITDSLLVNVGTGGQVSVFSESPITTTPESEVRPFPGNGYLIVGASLSGGKAYANLETFLRQVCALFVDVDVPSLYDKMEDIIRTTILTGEKLKVNPQFFGTRREPQKSGQISNILSTNLTPEHLIMGFLEGISNELFLLYEMLPTELKSNVKTLVGSGNAIRKSQGLRQALANHFGIPVHIPKHLEEAALGAALCAGVGTGFYQNFEEAGRSVKYTESL